jgi:iron-sulfur cluster repair protein YtfE (RIC family)
MNDSVDWLNHDHRKYEALLLRCQIAAENEDWEDVEKGFEELAKDLKTHIVMEENILYPAYEFETNTPSGPTAALRREHDEIVRLLRDLSRVIPTRNSEQLLESFAPLERAMELHHDKEEEIFLPMAGHALLGKRSEILERLKGFDVTKSSRDWGF